MRDSRPGNPDVDAESIAGMLARTAPTFPATMEIEPVSIDDERAIGRLEVGPVHLHPGGFVHGGAWVGIADTVAAWQTFRHLEAGWNFTSVEMKLNVFAGARLGDELVATATHLHAGRSTHVVEVRVTAGERLAANLIVTQFVLPPDG